MAGLEGTTLGAYQIIRRIGSGGMGDIYVAEQPKLGRRVAIKVLRDGAGGAAATDADGQRRFEREARAVSALEHPHILPIYDYGHQDGMQYLVMQYVPDGSLADLIAPGPPHLLSLPLAPALAADLLMQCAEALQYAHDSGVIHRDIKPHNLLVRVLARPPAVADPRLHMLLADFGLARFLSEITGRTGTTGTPLYSAPEQYTGHPGPASDQYALACVAYLLLAGRPVFDGSVVELHHQHLAVTSPQITRANPRLPAAADAVLARALAKNPAERYPCVRDFGHALSVALHPGASAHTRASADLDAPPHIRNAPVAVPAIFSPAHSPASFPAASPLVDEPAAAFPPYPAFPARFDSPLPPPIATPDATPAGAYAGDAPLFPDAHPAGYASLTPSPIPSPATSPIPSRPLSEAEPPPWPSSQAVSAAYAPYAPPGQTPTQPIHEPDAPGAPIPRLPSRRQRRWRRLPARRRALYVAAAVALVLTVLGSLTYTVLNRPQPPQPQTVAFGHVARTGVVNMARLPELRTGQQSAQATLPVRPLRPDVLNPPGADRNPALAAIPATIPGSVPDGADQRIQSKFGIGQDQIAIAAPLDVSVAASDHFVLEAVDGALQLFGYNGQVDGQAIAAADFFAPVLQPKDTLGQPRVLFDTISQRWVVVMNETAAQDSGVTNGYLDLAISQDAQPLSLWSLYQISTQQGSPAGCTWADAPQIGADAISFYLTANGFDCGDAGGFRGVMLWALPKQSFLTGRGTTFLRWSGSAFSNSQHQPVFTLTPAVESGSEGVEWLMSSDAGYVTGGKTSRQVIVWAILNPAAVERGSLPTVVGVVARLPLAYADPPAAIQPNTSAPLITGDARVAALRSAGGHLYAAFTTAVNWQGDSSTRSGVYWLDLTATATTPTAGKSTPSASAHVNQAGIFGFAGGYTFYPALAAGGNGGLALLVGASSAAIAPSLIYSRRGAGDPPNVLGAAGTTLLLQPGLQPSGGSRWGDYMGACLAFPGSDAAAPTVWVAGPYMADHPAHWQTLVWQMRL